MVYPEGLTGGLELMVTSLPESLAHGMSMLDNEPTFLQMDLSQFTAGDCESEAPAYGRTSVCSSPTHLTMEHPPKQRPKSA